MPSRYLSSMFHFTTTSIFHFTTFSVFSNAPYHESLAPGSIVLTDSSTHLYPTHCTHQPPRGCSPAGINRPSRCTVRVRSREPGTPLFARSLPSFRVCVPGHSTVCRACCQMTDASATMPLLPHHDVDDGQHLSAVRFCHMWPSTLSFF